MNNPPRILIVEDEPNMRELVKARLELAGYAVAVAPDGFAGIGKAREFGPDLVILDLMLPRVDGYTVCRMLKSGGFEKVPVILFSARSAPEDARRGQEMGADAFVSKPFEQEVLLAKIAELLEAKRKAEPAVAPGLAPAPETPKPA